MSIWIKICGNTSLQDAQLAAEAGADAVGFVFAPSPRRVTVEQVKAITPQLPAALEKIGVFVDAGFEDIVTTVETAGLTGIQLHFDPPPALAGRLRERCGARLRILGVLHFGAGASGAPLFSDSALDAILVDSCTPSAPGGTGIAYDWESAGKALFRNTSIRQRLIAAGGLRPENIAQAIRALQPWGVDVASGVESSPGRKDPAKVRAFLANARASLANARASLANARTARTD